MKKILFLTVFMIIVAALSAQSPIWLKSSGADSSYDPDEYLTGFGLSSLPGKNAKDALENAKQQALRDLVQKLKVRVEAATKLSDSQSGLTGCVNYQSDVKTLVSLDLGGVETFESAFDSGRNCWAALAVLDKHKMLITLETERAALLADLDGRLAELKDLSGRRRLDLLQTSLNAFQGTLDKLVQNVAVSRLLGSPDSTLNLLTKYYQARSDADGAIRKDAILSSQDVVEALIKAYDWKSLGSRNLVVIPAVYKTSEISGPFSQYIRNAFVDELKLKAPKLKVLYGTPDAPADLELRGSFYEQGKGWGFVYRLCDKVKGTVLAHLDLDLDEGFVKAQKLAFLPDNINVAKQDWDLQQAVYDNPVPTELQAWTNKGKDGLVFEEGEYVDFYVQCNRPGYISVLYNLAGKDRLRVPLYENIQIFPKDIGKPVKLDRQGPFTPPFGSESAQFFFSSNPIPKYQTEVVTVEGVEYPVLAEDYKGFVVTTRGLGGIKKDSSSAVDTYKTDITLAITSVAKEK
jgi:hypothetical protein